MSTCKSEKVEDILQRLRYAKKFNTWKEVGEYLGEKEATISIWRKRNSPSAPEKILHRCAGDIPERYLLTGEGPMSASGPTIKDLMLRTPYNPNAPQANTPPIPTTTDEEMEGEISEEEIVNQTLHVIRSKTIYRSALLSNVRAFYAGVKREEDMVGIDEKMNQMQADMRDIRGHNARMEELLLSLGATAKKRDEQANS